MIARGARRRDGTDGPAVPPDEAALVRRARAGDTEAFGDLVRRHQDVIYRLAVRMVGPDSAEDVAQGAFLKAWTGLERFRGGAAFGTWLYRIAANLCLDHLRSAARFRPLPLDDALAVPDGYDLAEAVVADAERADQRAALAEALAALPPEDRLILALRAGEELSYEAIGAALDLAPGTVGTRLHRARARLHRLLTERLQGRQEDRDGLR